MKKVKVVAWLILAFFVLLFLTGMGVVWIFQVPALLVTGWFRFLSTVGPEVTFRWGGIAEAVAVGAVLGVGTHLFLRGLWRQLRSGEAWPVRWSVSLLALIVLLFGATMATVGVGHQVGWLMTDAEPVLVSEWQFRARHEDNHQLCREALKLAERGMPDVLVTQRLLARPESRAAAERLHVVSLRGPDGVPAFVVFPRDPVSRQQSGGARCRQGKLDEELIQAVDLPRLLSGEQVVAIPVQ